MADCSCSASDRAIRFSDVNGAAIANFIALCGGGYWGGRTHDALYQVIAGTQMWVSLKGMLDLIGRLANLPGDDLYYKVEAGPHYLLIMPEMQADQVAAVLGCDAQEVVDHFRVLITTRGQDG